MSNELKVIPFNLPVLLLRSPFPKTEAMARLAQACGECGVEVQMIPEGRYRDDRASGPACAARLIPTAPSRRSIPRATDDEDGQR